MYMYMTTYTDRQRMLLCV